MIPKPMETFLREHLPESTWENRLVSEGDKCYLEFGALDVDRLARLGIEVDNLGPRLVVCMWDEASLMEVGGYLVVDNLAMGRPSMGGIRLSPDITPASIYNLARGMTLKNAAANLPYGGGKAGLVARDDLSAQEHTALIEAFARLIYRYHGLFLPGPDVGTNDSDMGTIAMFNGLDNSVSKPVGMGGNCIDELGAAGGGVVIALDALLDELPRLRTLSHFSSLKYPRPLSILIQGFGAVGAHAARIFKEKLTDAVVIGISDVSGYLYDENGLPVEYLFQMWRERGVVARTYFAEQMAMDRLGAPLKMKYGSQPDDLLRESGFCLIPAAPIANYLDTDISSHPSMTIDRMGQWAVIVEGANTYSPDPTRRAARARMEREVYRERGVLIATDFLVNSGGVIFAAQEQLIKTPPELRIPDSMLGNRKEVERWLKDHSDGLQNLAAHRLQAAEVYRDEVIRRNMRELVDLLVADADLLPYEASERISIRRIASRESDRTASDIMENILTIGVDCPIRQAASKLVEAGSVILAVLNEKGALAGVVTDWDLTRAAAEGTPGNQAVETIMTREVVTSAPTEGILEMVRKLEYHDISALPVVDRGKVLGMVSADLLARGSLYRLLQSQLD